MNPIQDLVDAVWELMREGEYYSSADLASMLECPTEAVTRVLDFLAKYKFARKFGPELFYKISGAPSPKEALNVLLTMIEAPNEQATQLQRWKQP